MSSALEEPPYTDRQKLELPPWGLALAARESLLYGNEHRAKVISPESIRHLMRRFFHAEALPHTKPGNAGFLLSAITPMLYEQFPWQESMFEEIARSHALIVEGLNHVDTEVISESSLADLLGGIPLDDAIGATFVLQVGAYQNSGVFDPQWLDQDNFREVLKLYPRRNLEATARRLTATRDEFREDFVKHSHRDKRLARYDYNPLVRTPFIRLEHGLTVSPAPRLIMRTVTPGGLYYPGITIHGNAFSKDLGMLFEHYIGRNLRLIDGAEIHPEVTYGPRKDMKSTDWFVVFPRLVMLVECKLKRIGLLGRAGDESLFKDFTNSVKRAYDQLKRSVDHLAAKIPEFSHIPTDRPLLALVVSAEPIYSGSAFLVEHGLTTISSGQIRNVPVAVVNARDIEVLVTHGADVEDILLETLSNHTPVTAMSLRDVRPNVGRNNSILDNAWSTYPFPRTGLDSG